MPASQNAKRRRKRKRIHFRWASTKCNCKLQQFQLVLATSHPNMSRLSHSLSLVSILQIRLTLPWIFNPALAEGESVDVRSQSPPLHRMHNPWDSSHQVSNHNVCHFIIYTYHYLLSSHSRITKSLSYSHT